MYYNFQNKIQLKALLLCFDLMLLTVFFSSCGSKPASHKNVSFTNEAENGKLKKVCESVVDTSKDYYMHHCKMFYANGALAQEGNYINDSIEIGWHTYYRENGSLKARREFVQIASSKYHLNRVIRFDDKGDTLKSQSNYYTIVFEKDTVKLGDELHAYFEITAPFFEGSYMEVSLTNPNNDIIQLPCNKTLSTYFAAKTELKGAYDLQGFLEEIKKLDQKGDTLKVQKRRLYFSKKYWVE